MIPSILFYAPPSVEFLGPRHPSFQTKTNDTPSFQMRLMPLSQRDLGWKGDELPGFAKPDANPAKPGLSWFDIQVSKSKPGLEGFNLS